MTCGALTNEVGYITDIPWLLGIYRSKTTPSPSGCALGFGVVFDDKSLQPWYNYYLVHPHLLLAVFIAICSPVRGRLKGTAQTVILHRPQLPVGYLDNPQTKPLMSWVYLDKPQCSKV